MPGRARLPVRAAQLPPLRGHLGPTPLTAADIEVPDLRGGFSHLIAALAAKGTSTVRGISLIDRGYENFQDKLVALGADVRRD